MAPTRRAASVVPSSRAGPTATNGGDSPSSPSTNSTTRYGHITNDAAKSYRACLTWADNCPAGLSWRKKRRHFAEFLKINNSVLFKQASRSSSKKMPHDVPSIQNTLSRLWHNYATPASKDPKPTFWHISETRSKGIEPDFLRKIGYQQGFIDPDIVLNSDAEGDVDGSNGVEEGGVDGSDYGAENVEDEDQEEEDGRTGSHGGSDDDDDDDDEEEDGEETTPEHQPRSKRKIRTRESQSYKPEGTSPSPATKRVKLSFVQNGPRAKPSMPPRRSETEIVKRASAAHQKDRPVTISDSEISRAGSVEPSVITENSLTPTGRPQPEFAPSPKGAKDSPTEKTTSITDTDSEDSTAHAQAKQQPHTPSSTQLGRRSASAVPSQPFIDASNLKHDTLALPGRIISYQDAEHHSPYTRSKSAIAIRSENPQALQTHLDHQVPGSRLEHYPSEVRQNAGLQAELPGGVVSRGSGPSIGQFTTRVEVSQPAVFRRQPDPAATLPAPGIDQHPERPCGTGTSQPAELVNHTSSDPQEHTPSNVPPPPRALPLYSAERLDKGMTECVAAIESAVLDLTEGLFPNDAASHGFARNPCAALAQIYRIATRTDDIQEMMLRGGDWVSQQEEIFSHNEVLRSLTAAAVQMLIWSRETPAPWMPATKSLAQLGDDEQHFNAMFASDKSRLSTAISQKIDKARIERELHARRADMPVIPAAVKQYAARLADEFVRAISEHISWVIKDLYYHYQQKVEERVPAFKIAIGRVFAIALRLKERMLGTCPGARLVFYYGEQFDPLRMHNEYNAPTNSVKATLMPGLEYDGDLKPGECRRCLVKARVLLRRRNA